MVYQPFGKNTKTFVDVRECFAAMYDYVQRKGKNASLQGFAEECNHKGAWRIKRLPRRVVSMLDVTVPSPFEPETMFKAVKRFVRQSSKTPPQTMKPRYKPRPR